VEAAVAVVAAAAVVVAGVGAEAAAEAVAVVEAAEAQPLRPASHPSDRPRRRSRQTAYCQRSVQP